MYHNREHNGSILHESYIHPKPNANYVSITIGKGYHSDNITVVFIVVNDSWLDYSRECEIKEFTNCIFERDFSYYINRWLEYVKYAIGTDACEMLSAMGRPVGQALHSWSMRHNLWDAIHIGS